MYQKWTDWLNDIADEYLGCVKILIAETCRELEDEDMDKMNEEIKALAGDLAQHKGTHSEYRYKWREFGEKKQVLQDFSQKRRMEIFQSTADQKMVSCMKKADSKSSHQLYPNKMEEPLESVNETQGNKTSIHGKNGNSQHFASPSG